MGTPNIELLRLFATKGGSRLGQDLHSIRHSVCVAVREAQIDGLATLKPLIDRVG